MTNTTDIDTLIVVCCHAIWIGEPESLAFGPSNVEDGWLISSFQSGETPTFVKHIQAGLDALRRNPNAILVFSGGSTKPERTNLTEAGTYLNFMKYSQPDVFRNSRARLHTENSATDSFQNVLFSLLQFPCFVRQSEVKGPRSDVPPSPRRLIVIGHEFKRARFEELHLPALRHPTDPSRFQYIGIDPPFSEQKMREIKEGDAKLGYGLWKDDLYGTSTSLTGKRAARGWTKGGREDSIRFWKAKMPASISHNVETKEQFENIFAFVEGTEKSFPEKVPWS